MEDSIDYPVEDLKEGLLRANDASTKVEYLKCMLHSWNRANYQQRKEFLEKGVITAVLRCFHGLGHGNFDAPSLAYDSDTGFSDLDVITKNVALRVGYPCIFLMIEFAKRFPVECLELRFLDVVLHAFSVSKVAEKYVALLIILLPYLKKMSDPLSFCDQAFHFVVSRLQSGKTPLSLTVLFLEAIVGCPFGELTIVSSSLVQQCLRLFPFSSFANREAEILLKMTSEIMQICSSSSSSLKLQFLKAGVGKALADMLSNSYAGLTTKYVASLCNMIECFCPTPHDEIPPTLHLEYVAEILDAFQAFFDKMCNIECNKGRLMGPVKRLVERCISILNKLVECFLVECLNLRVLEILKAVLKGFCFSLPDTEDVQDDIDELVKKLLPSLKKMPDTVNLCSDLFIFSVSKFPSGRKPLTLTALLLKAILGCPFWELTVVSCSLVQQCLKPFHFCFLDCYQTELCLQETYEVMKICTGNSNALQLQFLESGIGVALADMISSPSIEESATFISCMCNMVECFLPIHDDEVAQALRSKFVTEILDAFSIFFKRVSNLVEDNRGVVRCMMKVILWVDEKDLPSFLKKTDFFPFAKRMLEDFSNGHQLGDWIIFSKKMLDRFPREFCRRFARETGLINPTAIESFRVNIPQQVRNTEIESIREFLNHLSKEGNDCNVTLEKLKRLRRKLQRPVKQENVLYQARTVVEILKTLYQKTPGDAFDNGATTVEIIRSGILKALLQYFLPEADSKRGSLKFCSIDSLVTARIRLLWKVCFPNHPSVTGFVWAEPPLRKLFHALNTTLDLDGEPDFQLKHCRDTGRKIPCVCSRYDPRYNNLLLLGVLYQANQLITKAFRQQSAESRTRGLIPIPEFGMPHLFTVPADEIHNHQLWQVLKEKDDSLWTSFARFHPYIFKKELKMEFRSRVFIEKEIGVNVRFPRQNILPAVQETFDMLCATKIKGLGEANIARTHSLGVSFLGEPAIGLGVKREFFTVISQEFRDPKFLMWCQDDSNEAAALFPRPLGPKDSKLTDDTREKFRLLGRFMAKALLENCHLDLPLSTAFYKLAFRRENLGISDLFSFHPTVAQLLLDMKTYAKLKKMNPWDKSLSIEGVTRMEDLCLFFTVPGYDDYPLSPANKDAVITLENVEKYVDEVMDAYFYKGVCIQIEAFRQGFSDILNLSWMEMFLPEDFDSIFNGAGDWGKWSSQMLWRAIDFQFGNLTESESECFRKALLEALSEFDSDERKKFLLFVTGSARLPSSDLSDLDPAITVRGFRAAASQALLPSAHTCVRTLEMPNYSNQKAIIKSKLKYSISNDSGFGFI